MASQIINAFKSNPSHDELRAMDRDLRFYPSQVENPTHLSAEDVAAFNRDGYLKGIQICDEPEIIGHRAFFDEQLAKAEAAGLGSFSLSSGHLKYAKIYDLMHHRKIIACVSDLLGPEIIGLAAHYFCKLPNDGTTVSWHQDASYWPLTPSKTVTVWLAIDDADEENGAMAVIPGSHRHGQIDFARSADDENNVLNQTVQDALDYGETPVALAMKAGQISLHTDLLLHGSEPNSSHRRRCGLTMRFVPPDVLALNGWNGNAVICRGSDSSGHWEHHPRPDGDEFPESASCA